MTAAQSLADAYTAAWNTGSPAAVAAFFACDGSITINAGTPWHGRDGVAAMASGFFADIPDLALCCDAVRTAGSHVAYLWTFTGTHSGSGNPVNISGWEEWQLATDGTIQTSLGWFDADDYARQTAPQ
ncbi:MAG: SgcJ/EcaC family oxidoreductase [Polymorphobacter sp.]